MRSYQGYNLENSANLFIQSCGCTAFSIISMVKDK
jgi:hypothetical protein